MLTISYGDFAKNRRRGIPLLVLSTFSEIENVIKRSFFIVICIEYSRIGFARSVIGEDRLYPEKLYAECVAPEK